MDSTFVDDLIKAAAILGAAVILVISAIVWGVRKLLKRRNDASANRG